MGDTLTAAATQLMWILPTAYFALKEARYLGRPEFADAIDAVITASGELMLVAGIFLDVYAKQPLGQKIANILTPMPSLFCWLNMSAFRESEAAPLAIGGNLLADFVGYVGGGLELMLDTLQSKPKTAVA